MIVATMLAFLSLIRAFRKYRQIHHSKTRSIWSARKHVSFLLS
jgi:hypothetical protein